MKKPVASSLSLLFVPIAAVLLLSACGGSSGVSATGLMNADGGAEDLSASDNTIAVRLEDPVQVDELSCSGNFDIADLLVTESDRQWSCEIVSDQGSSFSDVFFSRRGTVVFADNDIRYWNRNLPLDQLNIVSPTSGFSVLGDIESFNTVMSFTLSNEVGISETYNCVLTSRDTAS